MYVSQHFKNTPIVQKKSTKFFKKL